MDERMMLRRRISAYAFAIWELEVFLDTHPDNQRAMETRKEYQQMLERLKAEYEKAYGPYILYSADVQGDRWTWIDDPWPWDPQKGE